MITGATGGIGRALAHAYASYGAQLLLLAPQKEALCALQKEIEAIQGIAPHIFPIDFKKNDLSQYTELQATIFNTFNSLEGLIHCAGYTGPLTPLEYYPAAIWQDVMQINLHSPFILTQYMMPLLRQATTARIIFTVALATAHNAFWGAYGIANQGIASMVHILAEELEATSNLQINSIDPGPTRTTLRAKNFPGENPALLKTPQTLNSFYLYVMQNHPTITQGQHIIIDTSHID